MKIFMSVSSERPAVLRFFAFSEKMVLVQVGAAQDGTDFLV